MRQRSPDICLQTLLQTSVSRLSSRHLSPDTPPDICLQTLLQTSVSRHSSKHPSPDSPPDICLQTLLQTSVSRLSTNFRQRPFHHSSTATPCDEDNHGWLVTDGRLARPPNVLQCSSVVAPPTGNHCRTG